MRKTLDALRRLRATAQTEVDSRLAGDLVPEIELKRFSAEAIRLKQTLASDGAGAPKGVDTDDAWRRWDPSSRSPLRPISTRESRALCWERRAASDRRFIEALENEGYIPAKTGFVRGLWHAHQQNWRLPTAVKLESIFARAALDERSKPRWLRTVAQTQGVLTEKAPEFVAQVAFKDLANVSALVESLGLTTDGALSRQALDKCRGQWFELLEQYAREENDRVRHLLKDGIVGLLGRQVIEQIEFQSSVVRLLKILGRAGTAYRSILADWIVTDERLGHPRRSATSPNWAGYPEQSKLAALKLFAAKDIGRFFDILIGKRNDHQGRRLFWEKYIDSPQFTDYAIACDPLDRRRLISAWNEGTPVVAKLDYAPFEHSAFIMRFRTAQFDLVIVEVSKANNSMYLFNLDTFEKHVGSLAQDRFSFKELKSKGRAVDYWAHSPGWQDRFPGKLRTYGIFRG